METITKVCTKCKIEKSLTEFYARQSSNDGYMPKCKECDKQYKQDNRDNRRVSERKYKQKYKQKNIEKVREYQKKWRRNNTKYHREYQKNRRQSNPTCRMIDNIRSRINLYCKSIRKSKTTTTQEMIGLDLNGFKSYMEAKFQDGMTWDNYGKWHVDHIKPLSLATTEQEIIELNHYTNLQPLWASDNLKKSNKYEEASHGNYGESFV